MSPSQSGSYFSLPFVNCKFGKSGSYHSLTFLACNRVQLKFNLKLVSSDNFWFSREKSSSSWTLFLFSSAAERGFDSWLSLAQSAFKLGKFLRKKVFMCQIGSYHEIVYISWKWQKCKTARNWFSLFCSWQLFISQSILKYFHKERANSAELCTALYPSRKHNQMYYLRFEGWKYALSVKRMLLVFIRGELLWASEHGNGARRWELPFMELSDITFNSLYKSHPPSSGSPSPK